MGKKKPLETMLNLSCRLLPNTGNSWIPSNEKHITKYQSILIPCTTEQLPSSTLLPGCVEEADLLLHALSYFRMFFTFLKGYNQAAIISPEVNIHGAVHTKHGAPKVLGVRLRSLVRAQWGRQQDVECRSANSLQH